MPITPEELMVQIKADNPTYEKMYGKIGVAKSDLHDLVEMLKVKPLKATPTQIVAEMKKISGDKWKKYARTWDYLVDQLKAAPLDRNGADYAALVAKHRDMAANGTYSDVQFIGYAVSSSGVKNPKSVTPNNGKTWFIQGDYVGTKGDKVNGEAQDVENRLAIMKDALTKAKALGKIDASPKCLKVFVSPEFFFRGPRGAYEMDDYQKAIAGLAKLAKENKQDWVFCFGSVLGMWKDHAETLKKVRAKYTDEAHKRLIAAEEQKLMDSSVPKKTDPAKLASWAVLEAIAALVKDGKLPDPGVDETLECRNVVLVAQGSKSEGEGHAVVKEFTSTVDFTVLNAAGKLSVKDVAMHSAISPVEADTGDRKGKEVQVVKYDGRGVFKLAGVTFGVEICLDHHENVKRLKSANAKVQVHLVPSCGMSLKEPSLVACDGGLAFNCDGAGTPHTMLWEVKGGKKAAEIGSLIEGAVASALAAGHLGKDAGNVHVYAPQILPELK
jgi:hypothetical protein